MLKKIETKSANDFEANLEHDDTIDETYSAFDEQWLELMIDACVKADFSMDVLHQMTRGLDMQAIRTVCQNVCEIPDRLPSLAIQVMHKDYVKTEAAKAQEGDGND